MKVFQKRLHIFLCIDTRSGTYAGCFLRWLIEMTHKHIAIQTLITRSHMHTYCFILCIEYQKYRQSSMYLGILTEPSPCTAVFSSCYTVSYNENDSSVLDTMYFCLGRPLDLVVGHFLSADLSTRPQYIIQIFLFFFFSNIRKITLAVALVRVKVVIGKIIILKRITSGFLVI